MDRSRIASVGHRAEVMSAEDAALLIAPNTTVGLSGFTASGYPTAVPLASAARIEAEHAAGPCSFDEARSWHARFVRSGSMRPG